MTFPTWLLPHKGLTDCDKVVLMMLDQLAWREGDRDGVVLASNEEIGQRLGKSAATIKVSLRRIAAFEPPLIAIDKPSANARDSIRLLYDRYGQANIADCGNYPLMGQILPTPVSSYQKNGEDVAIEGDPDFMGRILPRASAGQILPTLPLNREEDVVVVQEGGVGQILPTLAEVNATVETVAILPVGPRTLPELIGWLRCFTDDPEVIGRLERKLPLWRVQIQNRLPGQTEAAFCDWTTDALIASTDATDPVKYAAKILKGWATEGGRAGIEIKAPEPEVIAPADLPPVHPMPPPRIARFPSKAERNTARYEARRASMARLYPKEASDGPR